MKTAESQMKREVINGTFIEDKKAIESLKKAASYLELAAREYRKAADYHADRKHDLAFTSMMTAQGNVLLARKCEEEVLIHHTLNN